MNPIRGTHNVPVICTPQLEPIIPRYRTSLPSLWPHVFPLCSDTNGKSLPIKRCHSVKVINPSVLEETLRRRFRRGCIPPGKFNVHLNDSDSVRAFEQVCEQFADNVTCRSYSVARLPPKLRSDPKCQAIVDCLHELAPFLSTFEVADILRDHIFALPAMDRVTLINCLLNMSSKP